MSQTSSNSSEESEQNYENVSNIDKKFFEDQKLRQAQEYDTGSKMLKGMEKKGLSNNF